MNKENAKRRGVRDVDKNLNNVKMITKLNRLIVFLTKMQVKVLP